MDHEDSTSLIITDEKIIKRVNSDIDIDTTLPLKKKLKKENDESLLANEENTDDVSALNNDNNNETICANSPGKVNFTSPEVAIKRADTTNTNTNTNTSKINVNLNEKISKHVVMNTPSKKLQAVNFLKTPSSKTEKLDEQSLLGCSHNKFKNSQHDDDYVFDENIPKDIIEEMTLLLDTFPGLDVRYKLLDKIGEGTFSSVYKARDKKLQPQHMLKSPLKHHFWSSKHHYVALKRIYVTSSPQRIYNELNLLYTLSKCPRIAPLYDAIRYQDQIIAVLPYYPHEDFRTFYRILPIKGIKKYMFELLEALKFIHSKGVIHRDIKPTNFLYNTRLGKGVLVDFGLAELEYDAQDTFRNTQYCPCVEKRNDHICNISTGSAGVNKSFKSVINISGDLTKGYPKHDTRRGRRANRAGTRGFRAPEVLLKCSKQTTKIDIWSCGVILLCFLARRFPMFQSLDDIDSLLELCCIFGYKELKKCAELHGLGVNISSNLNGITEDGIKGGLKEYVRSLLLQETEVGTLPSYSAAFETLDFLDNESSPSLVSGGSLKSNDHSINVHNDKEEMEDADNVEDPNILKHKQEYYSDHFWCFLLLEKCFDWNYHNRPSADDLLKNIFFDELNNFPSPAKKGNTDVCDKAHCNSSNENTDTSEGTEEESCGTKSTLT
ncbi:related to Cell division control protein 7 [Saccharomycodes ludwigii]|uniref:non-specific serine/threonine protein kinase n=1 Tax=Saccharomycodes ludwigii TaxID=36035 RepID=A0A376BA65_9ASCO|nr:hypothetical protein SCDLUD_002394 [Saccharomycodes ludwigii]KAH3900933.1 hypothetical protein SCDLUD_002394 [Saccharomycodes ludwigii]SSD61547.1 related to Cell division control protein 7 [Saccharomycodes ludwigii]